MHDSAASPAALAARRVDEPISRQLYALFREQAAERPDAIALTSESDAATITYRELARRARRLAARIRSCGIGPESRVALLMEPSPALVTTILAVLRTGAAYVPLDPAYPRARLRFLLADSQAALLLTDPVSSERLADPGIETWVCDREPARGEPGSLEDPLGDPDHLAYLIYTSGSTGTPKGVAVSHAAVARLLEGARRRFDFAPDEVWTLFHSSAFDFSVWEIWGALAYGGRLVVLPRATARSPEAFYRLLERQRVTVLNQTPSAFRQLRQEDTRARARLALRWVIFGGEALLPSDLIEWAARHSLERPRLVNMYGITETTVHVTWRALHRDDLDRPASGIGDALPHLDLHLTDARLRPVTTEGVTGELCVGGAGLARGYHRRPALTAERFVPHPFAGRPGTRLYRSGDGAERQGGELVYLGRLDRQLKVRGYRIEAGEVETALLSHPEVGEAVVDVRATPEGERRLVAWLVPMGRNVPSAGDLRAFLLARLPEPLVPGMFVALEAMPLTVQGKTDRRALRAPGGAPDPSAGQRLADAAFRAPVGETEAALAEIWRRVLRVERVGRDDNFYALGGDSILALRVAHQARAAGLDLATAELLTVPVLRELGARLKTAAAAPLAAPPTPAPDSRDLPDTLEASALQLGLLVSSELGKTPRYHNVATLRLSGPFDAERLRRALDLLTVEQPVLRTTFDLENADLPRRRLHAEGRLPLRIEDLRRLPEEEREAALTAKLRDLRRRGIDLTRLPQVRFYVHRLEDDVFALSHAEHHALLDGWSEAALLTRLVEIYAGLVAPQTGHSGVGLEPGNQARSEANTDTDADLLEPPVGRSWVPGGMAEDGAQPNPKGAKRLSTARRPSHPAPRNVPPVVPADPQLTEKRFLNLERRAEAASEGRRFFAERLKGAVETKIPGWPHKGARKNEVPRRRLSPELTARLRRTAQKLGFPLKSVLFAAHLAVLRQTTGQRDLVTGLVLNAREDHPGTEDVLGLYLNTLPARAEVAPGSWADLVRTAFMAERELLPHRHLALAAVRREHEVLFETVFNFTHFHVLERLERLPGFEVLAYRGEVETHWTLVANFQLEPRRRFLELDFDARDELGDARLHHLADLYVRALLSLAEDPGAPWPTAALLGPGERHQCLHEWSAAPALAAKEDLASRFAAQVVGSPDRVAAACGEESLTYAELDRRAARLSARLRELGVGSETRVALALERSLALLSAILGVIRTGGAYVPIDPGDPRERRDFLLRDSEAAVLISEGDPRRGSSPHYDLQIDPLRARDAPPATSTRHLEQLAYLMYTSGSTGRPKGVAVTHRAVLRLVVGSRFLELGDDLTFLQYAPPSFDAATLEIWAPLLNGGRLVLAPHRPLSLEELGERIARQRVHTLWLTAALFHQMVDERLEDFAPLRQLLAGGDALSVARVARVVERFPECRLINGYGPTENTTFTCCHRVSAADAGAPSVSLGRPIERTSIRVLDPELRPCGVGTPGELMIGGDGLARGYAGRPRLTAERFVPDAFADAPGERLYLSGDLGRFSVDGRVEFLGRRDHQVKIRGFRVEPGEIEAVLEEQAGVRRAVVLALAERGGPRLRAAVVTAEPTAQGLGERLRRALVARLPSYMVPVSFTRLDRLPMTLRGKLDRAEVAWRIRRDGDEERSFRAPQTAAEELLAAAFTEVLGAPRAGLDDDFLSLGGHSLLALQVVSRLRKTAGVELALEPLLSGRPLAECARQLEAARAAGGEPLSAAPRPAFLPLSFAQKRLWLQHRVRPLGDLYNVLLAFEIRGPLRAGALHATCDALVLRQESLRTVFPLAEHRGPGSEPGAGPESGPCQRILEAGPAARIEVDLRAVPAPRERGLALVRREARRTMDLDSGPLLRFTLIRLPGEESLLLVVIHHIVCDFWSLGVFLREMGALYQASTGGASAPPSPAVQYADFTLWQHRQLSGAALERPLAYWRRQLASLEAAELPFDRPRGKIQNLDGATWKATWGEELTGALDELSRNAGGTLFMSSLAAFLGLLHRVTGGRDLAVGTQTAGRDRMELEGLVGFFVNNLVLRLELKDDPRAGELLERVRRTALLAYSHSELPFEKLVAELRVERDLARQPLFQIAFQVFPEYRDGLELDGCRVDPLEVDDRSAKYDFTVALITGESDPQKTRGAGKTLTAHFQYDTALFDETTVRRLAEGYRTLLAELASSPEKRLSELALLSPAALHQVVVEWQDTATPTPDPLTPELIAARLESQGDVLALVDGERGLSYREFGRRYRALARRLRQAGAAPDDVVGILMERSMAAVVAAAGVLEAHCAYLPLVPSLPPERLRAMIEDSGARLVLARQGTAPLTAERAIETIYVDADGLAQDELTKDIRRKDALVEAEPPTSRTAPLYAENLAYVIFTSGSTGRPKGVGIAHRGLPDLAREIDRTLPDKLGHRISLIANPGFDASVWETWPIFTAGATLVVVPQEVVPIPPELLRWLAERAVEVVTFLPTPLAESVFAEQQPHAMALRHVGIAGEKLRRRPSRPLPYEVWDVYGPTESTVIGTLKRLDLESVQTIGRPRPGGTARLGDRRLRPVPPRTPGELLLGGTGTARGYLGRPALTAERFVPDPHAAVEGRAGARLYRTGDLVRQTTDGEIEFLGRIDQQIKVGGHRVEPGEIESALLAHPEIAEAAVVLDRTRRGGRLLAYLAPEDGAAPPPRGALRPYLAERLPPYMVPSVFVVLDTLPKTPSGKINRRALPAAEAARPDLSAEYTEPQGELERSIAEIWRRLLGLERVGVHDNFFELGGSSLLLVELHGELESLLGRPLEMVRLFEFSTVRAFRRHLAPQTETPSTAAAPSGASTSGEGRSAGERQREALRRRKRRLRGARRTG